MSVFSDEIRAVLAVVLFIQRMNMSREKAAFLRAMEEEIAEQMDNLMLFGQETRP